MSSAASSRAPSPFKSCWKRMVSGPTSRMPFWKPGQHALAVGGRAFPLGSRVAMRNSRPSRSMAVRVTVWLWV